MAGGSFGDNCSDAEMHSRHFQCSHPGVFRGETCAICGAVSGEASGHFTVMMVGPQVELNIPKQFPLRSLTEAVQFVMGMFINNYKNFERMTLETMVEEGTFSFLMEWEDMQEDFMFTWINA